MYFGKTLYVCKNAMMDHMEKWLIILVSNVLQGVELVLDLQLLNVTHALLMEPLLTTKIFIQELVILLVQ